MSVNSKMTAIADAIRNLLDISGTMGLDAMASNISSITKRGSVTGTISTKSEQYIIPAGYHNGQGSVGISPDEQAKIIPENIKSGVTILGVSGSASGDIYAIIAVTYPSGSICTCSDGTTTLTARDTSGFALFNVKPGTYTVECHTSDNSQSKSTSVTVAESDKGKTKNVTLSYSLHLFELGVGLANGYSMNVWNGGTFDENGLVFSSTNIRANIRPAIDLSEYKSMSVTYTYIMNSTGNGPGRIGFHSSNDYMSYDAYNNNFPASFKLTSNVTDKTVTLDISSLSGAYYFAIHTFDSTTFKITDIELFP